MTALTAAPRHTEQRSPRLRPRRPLGAVTTLVVLALVAACSGDEKGDDSGLATNKRTAQTAPAYDSGATLALSAEATDSGARMTIAIDAPDDSTEMQVGTDPTFTTTEWEPVTDEVERFVDGGYQEIFARFRTGPDDTGPRTLVAGLDVDLALDAATSDEPSPTLIGLTDPTTLTVDIEIGRIARGTRDEGDELVGADIDPEDLDSGWELNEAGGADTEITGTERATIPTDTGHTGDKGEETLFPVRHRVSLSLAAPLSIGTEYELASPLGTTSTFTIDDRSSRSPAVHANQVGYRPNDLSKRAYLSAPLGSDGIDDGVAFHVVDMSDGLSAYDGTAERAALGEDGEVQQGDLTGLDVWNLDFSDLTLPGRYRVCVDGIGCSETLAIDEDSTWLRAAATIARGLYHQRSGIALGEPTTSLSRPRPDHPDDGLVVHQSELTALEAADLPDDELFTKLVDSATDEVVAGAWGGHFDAGDWDRRTQHLWMVREIFDLWRVAPDTFGDLDLNIPESGDAVPDIVDEALWTLDLFRRMQRDDGAVRGGIESAAFPECCTPSWEDDIQRFAYAPDPWTTYAYASVAADASVALRDVDPTRSADYADSATKAMAWAQAAPVPPDYVDKVGSQRAVAAASMLALTGDAQWNTLFLEDTPFDDGPTDQLGCNANEICDAGWNYLWVDPQLTDPAVVSNIEQSFTAAATRSADASESTLFGWCMEDPLAPLVWGLGAGGTPHAITLLRAYLLAGDQRFLADAQRCASYTLGGNPLDTSFVTGLGATPARHPLIVDVNVGGLPTWAGTPVYGNHRLPGMNNEQEWVIQYRLNPAGATGDPYQVPYTQSWYDLADVGPMNEFTVYQSHGPALWVFGVLAATTPKAPNR